ncbi:MAG TPA: hypothetical protein VMW94_01995 [Actinomycetes bacterium]|nr:hypothetical protein [Actinomycetes bacterium]
MRRVTSRPGTASIWPASTDSRCSTFHEQMTALSGDAALVDAYRRLSLPGIMSQVQTTHDTDSHAGGDVHPRAIEGAGGRL